MSIIINNWRQFARVTVETGDIDPMYFLMNGMDKSYRERFATHFFMFYHAGEAAKCAGETTNGTFWDYVVKNYDSCRRGTERRHFRGDKGKQAIMSMEMIGPPNQIWEEMYATDLSRLTEKIRSKFKGCQIGPYFIWKAMDILDRCMDLPVNLRLSEAVKGMPEEPFKCARTLWPNLSVEKALALVTDEIKDLPAPGAIGKKCGYAEAETVLCMIKGFFLTKSHTIGDDVEEKYYQLRDYPELHKYLPARLDWTQYVRAPDLNLTALSL